MKAAEKRLEALIHDTQARRDDVAQRVRSLLVKGLRDVGKHNPFVDGDIAGEVADDLEGIIATTPGLREAIITAAKEGCGITVSAERAPYVMVVAINLLNMLAHGEDTLFGP